MTPEEQAIFYRFPFNVAQCRSLWERLISLPPDAGDYREIAAEYPFSEQDVISAHKWIADARSSWLAALSLDDFLASAPTKTRHFGKAISRKATRRMRRRYAR